MPKELKSIKSKLLSRSLALAKTGVKTAHLAAKQAIKSSLLGESDASWSEYLAKQAELLARDLGQLNGSVMKVGQLLSTYGEHLLPPEANDWLKSLQYSSPTLAWSEIEKVLLSELGAEKLAELDIKKEPVAAASIGQVHEAIVKSNQTRLALKVQYPGVERAIETDLKFLKSVLALGPLLPKGPRFDAIFDEVREMLYLEVDYRNEFENYTKMQNFVGGDQRYLIASPVVHFSTQRVLATEFIQGVGLDSKEITSLSLDARNQIGYNFLDLYLSELFEYKFVQTDPHFGNYKIVRGSEDTPRLALYDFGATRKVSDSYLAGFSKIVEGGLLRDKDLIMKGGIELKLILPDDSPELIKIFMELCYLVTEPFSGTVYDWGMSDLPKRVATKGAEVIRKFHLRAPPHETIFLDRKLGGTFIVLSTLGCKADWRSLVLQKIDLYKKNLAAGSK